MKLIFRYSIVIFSLHKNPQFNYNWKQLFGFMVKKKVYGDLQSCSSLVTHG